MNAQDARPLESARSVAVQRIAFLAMSQAHQFLHWLPAALRLAREPGVEVTVLVSTRAGAEFIRSYDRDKRLRIERLWAPSLRRQGLFSPPPRLAVLALGSSRLARFPILITSETTSGLLRRLPWFRSKLVLIKHGAGDREGSYNFKHALFDLILVNGEKHREGLIARRLTKPERCVVTGNAKLELGRPPAPIFSDGKPFALYNPHFDPQLSSWFRHASEIVRVMERTSDWNFVIAPHVKLRRGPTVRSDAANIIIDRGSTRSIDMTYTQAADVYIGDVSSQVYEFLRTPRPCIFLNLDRVDWRTDPAYAHWHLGQVIERVDDLPKALAHAHQLQPQFERAQRKLSAASIDSGELPASERQAQAILNFAKSAND